MARKQEEEANDLIKVTLSAVGDADKTVTLEAGATIADALDAAGYDTSCEVRCNGEVYGPNDVCEDGDTYRVLQGAKVKGGR